MLDFSLSKLHPNLIATGNEDAKIRLFKIPDEGLKTDISENHGVLSGHTNRINHLQFHPYVSNVLLSASPEQAQSPTVRLWDVNSMQEIRKLNGCTDLVLSCSWSFDGKSTIATACKDRLIRLFDPRAQEMGLQTSGHDVNIVLTKGSKGMSCNMGF